MHQILSLSVSLSLAFVPAVSLVQQLFYQCATATAARCTADSAHGLQQHRNHLLETCTCSGDGFY